MQVAVKDLAFAYRKKSVLNQVSFNITPGEVVGILGVNGAGKSTLFKLLCGLMPIQGGSILYDGQALNRQIKTRMGVVFQDSSLDPKLTCRENLLLFAGLYAGVEVPTEIAGLDLNQQVKNLSGGMKRKLELTRVFLHKPDLVLMDEPTTGLDLRAFEEFWSGLKQRKQTVILTTHKAEEAEKCDRLLLLHEGRIILSETPAEFKKRVANDPVIIEPRVPGLAEAFLKVTGVHLT
jgi:ABC-2 type transport system ATP-binding protein